LSLLVR